MAEPRLELTRSQILAFRRHVGSPETRRRAALWTSLPGVNGSIAVRWDNR